MKLYILYNKKSPYEYSDYPSNDDYWADIEYIATGVESLVKYVNHCRVRALERFRKEGRHRLDSNDDQPDFEWSGSNYYVLTLESDQEVDLDTRDAFMEGSYKASNTYKIYTLKEFFTNTNSQMWMPDREYVEAINKLINNKDNDVKDKIKQYKQLKEELHDRGYLSSLDR